MRYIFLVLFFPFISFGQRITIEGKVVNARSKEIIPFATVGLMKEKIGTNADENGMFTLVSQGMNENDTLLISCLGFRTQKLPIDKKKKTGFVIELAEQVMILKEVEYITYRPSIGWTDQVNAKMEAWMLDYNNVWRPMFKTMRNKTSVSIAATVTY